MLAVLTLHAYSFQAYTTCTVLLHSVAQKQLHDFDPLDWQDDMVRVADCLGVLEYCASLDPVAARFHEQLLALVHRLKKQEQMILNIRVHQGVDTHGKSPSPASDASIRSTGCSPVTQRENELTYLLDIPAHSDPSRVDVSLELLAMLRRPFCGSDKAHAAEQAVKEAWETDPARREVGLMVARLDCDFGSSEPFHWDFSSASVGVAAQSRGAELPTPPLVSHAPDHSTGNSAPSAWAPAPLA